MLNKKYFFLNGQKYRTNYSLNLFELTQYFNYTSSLFILEYNNLIYSKNDWKNITIKDNDKIEIVTIVGGG